MRTKWRSHPWISSLTMVFTIVEVAISDLNRSVWAQIIPDDTLGAESSLVTPDNIKGINSDRIDGGAIRGSNLFHYCLLRPNSEETSLGRRSFLSLGARYVRTILENGFS